MHIMVHFNKALINSKDIKLLLISIIILYIVYSLSYAPSMNMTNLPIVNQDSPYLSPEGWPLPYPYVPITSN